MRDAVYFLFLLLFALQCMAGTEAPGLKDPREDTGDTNTTAEKTWNGIKFQDLKILQDYLEAEHAPFDKGVRFRIQVERLATADVPIALPDDIAAEMSSVSIISGTVTSLGCHVLLQDRDGKTLRTLSTRQRGLLGITWSPYTLEDDEFSRAQCGYFPLRFNQDEFRLWPLRLLVACLSPVSLNCTGTYALCMQTGLALAERDSAKMVWLINPKAPGGPENTIVLERSGQLWACSSTVSRDVERVCTEAGYYAYRSPRSTGTGDRIALGDRYAVYAHAEGRLPTGIAYKTVLLEVELLTEGQ